VQRAPRRKRAVFEPGDKYFLVVWPDGLEQYIWMSRFAFGSARVRGALEVHVLAKCGSVLVEETATMNRPSLKREWTTNIIRPRGRGWTLHDSSNDKHDVWRRDRSWDVFE
jgi:hypothetical protein